jgi:hypothetical protein
MLLIYIFKGDQMKKKAAEAKPKGWFSRRYETNTAHLAAQENWENRSSKRPKQIWNEDTKTWEKNLARFTCLIMRDKKLIF